MSRWRQRLSDWLYWHDVGYLLLVGSLLAVCILLLTGKR